MLKVGWFPEYTPSEQQVFDDIQLMITQSYRKFWYMHIETPAVEKNEVLLKWWESASKEVFGLYGMASWAEDLKWYGLHFDLTIPFARYVLDHQGELVFPFKRYQVQPCWRWERAQRWRYRQFVQWDIDAIWRQDTDETKYLFFDGELIYLLRATLETIRSKYLPTIAIKTHINNRNILGWLLSYVTWWDRDKSSAVSKLFDNYYKIEESEFFAKVEEYVWAEWLATIQSFIALWIDELSENFIENEEFAQWVRDLKEVFTTLRMLNTNLWEVFIYDPFIVRWLDYYTGTVFENLIEWETALWSVCSWWRYANLTQSLDPKSQRFDGVGWSIGVSRLFAIIQERIKDLDTRKNGVVLVHFAETLPQIVKLAQYLNGEKGIAVDIYPGPDKFKKQLGYADKLWVKKVIMLGEGELEKGMYVVKDMESGEQEEVKLPF